ncbi:protein phosphatase 1G-like isoform X2 [Halichondria panicea]|uniref:protein phosphatase 1G-like isoform X2 n=1 Tax=Halichondria panicea TaxID=6063 RepID=UPI00312BAFD4
MGAYLRKPNTDKSSESGEYEYCGRRIMYASTAMQGWRIAMEDSHSVVPHFDQDSSLFAVYDGHGGKEVAVYCADKMGDLIKSTGAYKEGDIGQALKDAFINCDRQLLLPEIAQELKKIANDGKEEDKDSSSENIEDLMTEANMPLKMLMERYGHEQDSTEADKEGEAGSSSEGGGVKNILQMLCNKSGIDIEFDDSDDSESDIEPEDSDVTSDEDTPNLSSHDTPNPETLSKDIKDTSSLTALLQSRLRKSSPEASSTMEPMVEERPPTPPKPAASDKQAPSSELSNSSPPQVKSSSKDTESSAKKLDTDAKIKDVNRETGPEKPKGLKDLLTAGVEDKYNADGLPVQVEAGNEDMNKVGRKRPLSERDILLSPQTFCKRREQSEEGHESGTTAVVCLLRGEKVFVANAGDSRCILSSNGKAVELSFDHKPTDPLELARIVKAGGRVGSDGRVNKGLNLSRAIGDHFYKQKESLPLVEQMISPLPDIETAALDEGSEFLILACDGIWNCKTSQEAVDYVRARLTLKRDEEISQQDLITICEALCDECMAKNTDNDGTGCDNMTCILVLLKSMNQLT